MDTTNTSTVTKLTTGCRLVLLPLPFQGHLSPMLQLATILFSKGFSITILHTHFNSPNPTNYPDFTFIPIPGTGEQSLSVSDFKNAIRLLNYINTSFLDPIRECLERLMLEDDDVACLITDAQWFGTQRVADSLKLPRIVLRTSNISSFRSFAVFPLFRELGWIRRFSDEEKSHGWTKCKCYTNLLRRPDIRDTSLHRIYS